jgi:hypothetical protein
VLQDAASKQETLARSREDLLIERQRLISSRNQVRAKHLETRDEEAGLMSCLRNLMNDVQQKVPASLSNHTIEWIHCVTNLGSWKRSF